MKNKLIITLFIILVILLLCFILFHDTKTYTQKIREKELKIPASSEVSKITIQSDVLTEVERPSEIEYLIWTIEDTAKTRIANSNSDKPMDSDNYLTVTIYLKDESSLVLYYYENDNITYLEEPNKAIYTDGGAHDVFERFAKDENEDINKFYEDELLDEYVRIDKLSYSYLTTAISNDRGIIINYEALYNETTLDDFLNTIQKGESAFLRISKNSFVGAGYDNEITYYDVKYEKSGNITLITNRYSYDNKNNKMQISKYKYVTKLEYEEERYLILSDSKITQANFNTNTTKNAFILKLGSNIEMGTNYVE